MSDNIKSFKTEEELKAFIEAQRLSFVAISIKVRNLEEENENLKKKIEKLKLEQVKSSVSDQEMSNSEIICVSQIELLKKRTEERELTFEETKKFEVLTKIYEQIKSNKKSNDDELKNVSTEDLLTVLQGGKSEN